MKRLLLISILFLGCTVYVEKPDTDINFSNEPLIEDPTIIPDAPIGLTAIPGNGQITVEWESVENAGSYNAYCSNTQGVHDILFENVITPYTQTGLTNGVARYCVITAVNSAGESAESIEVSATPGIIDNEDGTVSVIPQGLMWAKCSQSDAYGGNTYNSIGNDCSLGPPATLQHCSTAYMCDDGVELLDNTPSEVYQTCKGLTIAGGGWRVPNTQELEGLHIYYKNNQNMWPDIVNDYYWPTTD
jgi:hypothetical protein